MEFERPWLSLDATDRTVPRIEEELALSLAMRAQLAAGPSTRTKAISSACAVMATLILSMWSGVGGWFMETPQRMALGGVGLLVIALLPGAIDRFRIRSDLVGGHFIRYRGAFVLQRYSTPDQTAPPWATQLERTITWAVVMPSAEIVIAGALADLLRDTGHGEIDYSPHWKLIFEIRNYEGKRLYPD